MSGLDPPVRSPANRRARLPEPGRIQVERRETGQTVLELEGRHDLLTAGELELSIADALRRGDGIVVDLRPTTFLDSAILQKLASGKILAEAGNRGFALLSGSPGVLRSLQVAGLLDRLAGTPPAP